MLKICSSIVFFFLINNVLAKGDSLLLPACQPLKELVEDASVGFKKATGNFIEVYSNDSMFAAKMSFPGAVASAIRNRNAYYGNMYEGTSYQHFDTAYINALNMLYDCLSPDEYEVSQIREAGNAQAKYYPDIEFRPREQPKPLSPVAGEEGQPKSAPKLAKGAKAQPAPIVRKPVIIYINANGKNAPGIYKVEVLIHTN